MDSVRVESPIVAALGRRLTRRQCRRLVADARAYLHDELEQIVPYQGGLRAEVDAARSRKKIAVEAARKAARQAWAQRRGRPIDLAALLKENRPDGLPRWAVMDPTLPLSSTNGKMDADGDRYIAGRWWRIGGGPGKEKVRMLEPAAGIPPLPPAARRVATNKQIRKRAAWVGLLYQPEEWRDVRPDPAIVVEWKDLPGQYFALVVWGHDGARIMEFVS